MKVEWVPFGELFQMERTPIEIMPDQEYRRIGIYSWGRGAFVRDPSPGTDMGSMKYFEFPRGALIFSNIQAWEGAVAVVDEDAICSSRFFPYRPRTNAPVDTPFVLEYFRSTSGLSILRDASSGTQVRNQLLSRSVLEDSMIPLPSVPDQERIANRLDGLRRMFALPMAEAADAAVALLGKSPLSSGRPTRLSEVLSPCPRSRAVTPDEIYALSGVKWYGEGLFLRESRLGRDISASTLRRIEPGDLVYNRLFAWKQSFAIASEPGWASNEFPTFAVRTDVVLPRVLLAALLAPAFTAAVNAASTGSTPTSRNRLREDAFLRLEVEIPARGVQAGMERALRIVDRAKVLADRKVHLRTAILHAARNEIFDAMR